MIDFEFSVKFKVSPNQGHDIAKLSWYGRFKLFIFTKIDNFNKFIDFLKNDIPENYRTTYDEGVDAYMILYNKEFENGFYECSTNRSEWFYKSTNEHGNAVAAFEVSESYTHNNVFRMEGVQMVNTDTIYSKSIAEIYITNCADINVDPYIPIRTSFRDNGTCVVWYGRMSKFLVDHTSSYDMNQLLKENIAAVRDWVEKNPEEDPDIIDLLALSKPQI